MWVLETERLALRQFTSADVDNLLQIFGLAYMARILR
jgi:hypothetical protein